MSTWEHYQTAYQNADEATKHKLHSSLVPECADALLAEYHIEPIHKRKIMRIVADIILGITSLEEVAKILSDIQTNPDPSKLLERSTQLITQVNPKYHDSAEYSEKLSLDTSNSNIASDIAETEAALAQVDAVRTMQRDMQTAGGGGLTDEPVYTSSQSALLRESVRTAKPGTAPVLHAATVIPTPSPVPNAAPSTTTAPNIPIRPVTIATHTNANTPVPIPPRADTAQIQTPRTAIPATAAPDMPRWETETEA
jgi:hypothetical protein